MPLHRRWRIGASAFIAALAVACVAPPAHALRVVTWNLTVYPSVAFPARQPHLRTVMAAINADVLIAQELNSSAGRDSFLNNVLNVVQPGEWAATPWSSLGTEGGAVFYKPAKVSVGPPSLVSTSGPRPFLTAIVTPVGYTAAAATFRILSMHLKAGGPATVDSTSRRLQCTDLRNILNALPAGSNFLLGGDSNFYGATEGGYIRLTESQLDNDGQFLDPMAPMGGNWHSNSGYALRDTQCPCNTGCTAGFSGGGLDDRFDVWLSSSSMQDGEGLDYFPDFTVSHGAYPFVYGNDGTKFNNDVNSGSNAMVGATVANALHEAADHLPVVITLQLPAKVVATPSLAFGTVIVGATANQNLSVSDVAPAPADELNYTLSAPAGFTAPGGTFTANAGAGANSHAIGMSTASSGVKSGNLTVNSNDVDLPVSNASLTGTVLDHAAASLDSAAIQVASTLDFGSHLIGGFTDHSVRVHDFGYDALQARLSVSAANIVGGGGRFSIVGGFSPTLLAGTGQSWNVHFNDVGATLDQEYTATLTFTSADEALPGATAATDLVVTLRATPLSSIVGVVPGRDLPKTLAFYAPHPNPLTHEALFSYDLPAAAPVSLAIYDLSGRRVANLVSGSQEADRYQVRWNAVSDGGARVRAGLYFARFTTPGMNRVSRLIVLP